MKFLYFTLTIVILLIHSNKGYSQQFYLKVTSKDSLNSTLLKKIIYKKGLLSQSEIENEKNNIHLQLSQLGFLNSRIATESNTDSIHEIKFRLNKQIKTILISLKNVDKEFIAQNKLTLNFNKIDIPFKDISSFLTKLTNHYEKKGYSFVKIKLINHSFINQSATAELSITKNIPRKIDRIVIKGYDNFPRKYINSILKQDRNNVFNKAAIKTIFKELKTIPFISIVKKPQVLFLKDSTLIYIYLKKKRINTFNGVVGFTSDKNSKIEFNGYLNLNLNNAFNKGEQIELQWKSTESKNKQISIKLAIPYIFNSNIKPTFNFLLYSQDSSFINVKSKLNLLYQLNYKNQIGLIVQTDKSTDLLKTPNTNIQDYNSILYGLNYQYTKSLNDTFYQYKTFLDVNLLTGNNHKQNKNSSKSKVNLFLSRLISIDSKNQLFIKNISSVMFSENISINEMDRIGGLSNLRGFKENSIPSSKYSIFNIEYNYLVNSKTSLYSITDLGYTFNDSSKTTSSLYALGLGFKTKLKESTLNFSYTAGKVNNQSFDLKKTSVNIQFLSFF